MLHTLTWDANHPRLLARFWAGLPGRENFEYAGGVLLPPGDGDPAPAIRFQPTTEPKRSRTSSTSI